MELSEKKVRCLSRKRGQISLEYMAIVGLTTLIAISLLAISTYYSNQVRETIDSSQIDAIGKQIVDTAESVYYFGPPSKTTLKVFIPKSVYSANISAGQVIFNVRSNHGSSEYFYLSSVPLMGNISSSYGFHYVSVESKEGYVLINST